MEYTIPVRELEKLQKKINHIARKGVQVKFDVGQPYIKEVYFEHPDPVTHTYYRDLEPTPVKVVDVDVEGSYKIDGWEFVGTIEHKGENGNIVRAINDNFKIPEEFYHKGPECDHCHRIRDRKDTYLIRNTETGEFKQVGKSCLREYTGGLDAAACAEWSTLDAWLMKMFNEEARAYYDGSMGRNGDVYYSSDKIKRMAYTLIKQEGYKKEGYRTVDKIENAYFGQGGEKIELASEEDLAPINDWVAEKEKTVDSEAEYGFQAYLRNAIIAWKEKYLEYRDLPLVVSLINTYFKDIEEKARVKKNAETSTSEFLGEVGDNVEFVIQTYRLLYVKDSFHYNAPSTRVYQISDDKGNIIILESSTVDLDNDFDGGAVGVKMKAKVKGHKEYKGTKQTVVNRAKVLGEAMSTAEALKFLKD